MTDENIYKLVDQSVGLIAKECGYHLAESASLEILTDVCCEYLRQLSTKLKTNLETEGWRDPNNDFVSSLERVFHQLNIPSAANLHQFISRMDAIKRHMAKKRTDTNPVNPQQQNQNQNQQQPQQQHSNAPICP